MSPRDRSARAFAWVLLVGSLLGTASALVVIGWPAEVGPDRFSHPFGPASYVVSQVVFAARDAAQALGMVGLCLVAWPRVGAVTRTGLVGCVVGTVALAAAELFALTATSAAAGSAQAGLVGAAYAPPVLLLGASAVVAGVGLARSRALPGALGRWAVLAAGAYVFVPLLPALFGPSVLGRVAIAGWLLIFAGIGTALLRAVPPSSSSSGTRSGGAASGQRRVAA